MTDLVSLNANGNAICTSLMVAEKFEKDHANVLKAVRNELATLPEEFGRVNFNASSYVNQQNKSMPMYEMTRDGFCLIAMGFTGEKAQQWKVEFINAFNAMEAELLRQNEKPQVDNPRALERLQMADIILSKHFTDNQLVLALDKVFKHYTGESVLKITNTQLVAPQQQQLYTPSELGRQLEPPLTPIKVNKLLERMGWQIRVEKRWEAAGEGEKHGVYLDTGKAHSDGTPVRQLKWTSDTIFAVQGFINAEAVDTPAE